MREGTEQAYSDLDFSSATSDGKLLASVGSNPDYMLTVWDWRQEKIVLRSKAFSQEIYRVTFSPDNEGQLTTSGTGHIRYVCTLLDDVINCCDRQVLEDGNDIYWS